MHYYSQDLSDRVLKMAPVSTKTQEKPKKIRIRGSKHKKRNWRRDNIKDVEDFLDEKRQIERIRSKAQRNDDELIKIKQKISARAKLSTENKKTNLPNFAYLDVDPQLVATPTETKPKRKTRNPIQKAKFRVAEVKRNIKTIKANSFCKPTKDLWENDEKKFDNDYLKEADEFFQQQTRKKQIQPPSTLYSKPSTLPAVEVPHPGASYNPVFEDHQNLLMKAREIELKKEKEEMHLDNVLTLKFPTRKDAPTEATWLKEMSQGLNQKEDEQSENESEYDDMISYNPPTLNRKKTKAQRNKEKRQKLLQTKSKKQKSERIRENEVYKIKSFLSKIKKKETLNKNRLARRMKRRIEQMAKPARLGRVKYEDPELEITLTTELQGTLRRMKPMGSLLEDRMKSLQRRNIIEPIIRQKNKRKYKLKTYTKKSHKE